MSTAQDLLEQLRDQQCQRWHNGDPVPVETYLHAHPNLDTDPDSALILIYQEIVLRTDLGEAPRLEEYVARFPQWRERLQRLFAIHSALESPGLLKLPPSLSVTPPEPEHALAESLAALSIPGYEVLAELGRGGAGIVYRARQQSLDRIVALKLLLTGSHATPEELKRFQAEAEAQARLQHPNIVPIHEVGACAVEGSGARVHYLVMEYVAGGSLADKLAGKPQPSRAAAQLVEVLARAMHFAHQHGLVHRDLKPGNILLAVVSGQLSVVSEDGAAAPSSLTTDNWPLTTTPKIADFGLAKQWQRQSASTLSSHIVGTPSYMAPEQAAGRTKEVGPATDVHALGAILYELLTGRPPFLGESVLGTLEQVQHDVPVAVRRLNPEVPRDLETICHKCLHKAPSRRYPSAEALAEDLRRFLADEPILARPVGLVERGIRWVRRRPAAAALVAVAVIAGLAVVGVAVTVAALSERERQAVAVERDEKEKQRAQAARARDRTFQALDVMISGVTGDSLEAQPTITAEQKKFLAEVLTYYQEFAAEQGDDEGTRRRTADAAHGVAVLHLRLGNWKASVQAFEQARAGYEQLAADFPAEPYYRAHVASSSSDQGLVLFQLGQRPEAEAAYRQALTLQEQLVTEFPDVPRYRRQLSRTHNSLGLLFHDLGKRKEAEAAYRQAVALQEQLVAAFPSAAQYRQDLADTLGNLGNLLRELGKQPEADAAQHRALALLEQLAADFPAVPEHRRHLAKGYNNLGLAALRDPSKRKEAEAAHRKALALREQLAAEFPAAPYYRLDLAGSYINLGLALSDLAKRPEAEAAYQKAVAILEPLATDFPAVPQYRSNLALAHHSLGRVLFELEKWPEAEDAYRKARALLEQLAADSPAEPWPREELAKVHNNWGALFQKQGRPSEAAAAYRKALEVQEQLAADFPTVPQYRWHLPKGYSNLGRLLTMQGQRAEAEAAFRQALAIQEQLAADFPTVVAYRIELAARQVNHGRWLRDIGKMTEALTWFDRPIAVLEPLMKAEPGSAGAQQHLRNAYWGRAAALDRLERPADGLGAWDRAVDLSPEQEKANLRVYRARSLVRAGQVERGVAEVAELAKLYVLEPDPLLYLARVYALAAGKDEAHREEHIQSALHLLRRAVANGYRDVEKLKKDDDLKLLRDHPEFQKLLADLESKQAAKP